MLSTGLSGQQRDAPIVEGEVFALHALRRVAEGGGQNNRRAVGKKEREGGGRGREGKGQLKVRQLGGARGGAEATGAASMPPSPKVRRS